MRLQKCSDHRWWTRALYGIAGLALVLAPLDAAAGPLRDRLRERLRERRAAESRGEESSDRQAGTRRGRSVGECGSVIAPIREGYGAQGAHRMQTATVRNPRWSQRPVTVFYPADVAGRSPVVFFSHGYGAVDYHNYHWLIEHLVSRGMVVVYAPYPTLTGPAGGGGGFLRRRGAPASADADSAGGRADPFTQRYAVLWAGFEAAVQQQGERMDLTRVGFAGHSFGGGATPAMAYHGFVERGWGSAGAFMYLMAPWYSNVTQEQLQRLPAHTNVLIQVYADDSINDHRMAIDFFRSIGVSQKEYVVLYGDDHDGCRVTAEHDVPGRETMGALKYYGVFRLADALADYAFNGNASGKEVALGHGSAAQRFMGAWPDGTPFHELSAESNPQPLHPESFYKKSWHARQNPRAQLQTF